MTPTGPIDAFILLCLFVGMFGLPLVGLLALAEWAVGRYNRRRRLEGRPRPQTERLLGDDWRDSVAHLFPTTNQRRETQ